MRFLSLLNRLKPPIKMYWWRLNEDRPGPSNFGDVIAIDIIEELFHRKVEWSSFEECDIVGAGSIIEEVTENKGNNRPYLWGSGFIQPGELTILDKDYEIIGVRGKESLRRVHSSKSDIVLGDPALLADCLVKRKHVEKKYKLGFLPHYVDADHQIVSKFKNDPDVLIIDSTWPSKKVVEAVASCEAVMSSSLHGLIVPDSLGVPNLHIKLSDGKIKGGLYKFNDYYSIYSQDRRHTIEAADIDKKTTPEIFQLVTQHHVPIPTKELRTIKQRLITLFPYK